MHQKLKKKRKNRQEIVFFSYNYIGDKMDKKQEFKDFISIHPELVTYVKNKEMTWQDFYEIYDIYGSDESAWSSYFKKAESTDKITELTSLFKNINLDNVSRHVNNAQKAINIIQELTKKSPEVITKSARPITKFYGD